MASLAIRVRKEVMLFFSIVWVVVLACVGGDDRES